MRTRRPQPGRGLGGRLDAALGAGTPQQRAALALTHGVARGGALLAVHLRNFEDWRSPEGEVFNSGARDRGVLARFDHVLAGGLLSASWQGDFGRDVERPRDNSRTVRFHYPEEDSRRLNLSWERGTPGSLSRLGVTAFAGRHSLVTDQDRYATATTPRNVERAEVSASDFHLRGYAHKPAGAARLEAGLDLNARADLHAVEVRLGYAASGEEAARSDLVAVEDARRVDTGAYASVDAPVGRGVSLAGGLRGDRVTSRNRGGHFGRHEADLVAVSGFASATLGPLRGVSTTIQLARGFRDPFLSDRYYRGPSGRGFITGSPDLEAETSVQLDLAVRYASGAFRSAAYAYDYRIHGLIERYETVADSFLFRNRGRARVRGLEAEAQVALPARLSLELAAHVIRGVALDDGAALDAIPPPTLTARVRRDFGRAAGWVRLGAFGRLGEPGPTERERAGYALLDGGVDLRLGSRLELRLLGRNLLDKAYRVGPDSRAVYAPGLTGVATMTLRF